MSASKSKIPISQGDPEEIFEMLEKLGEGSYGVVCKCRHKQDGKIYAVKVIEMEGEDDSAIAREIEILKECNSETVVRYGGCYRKGDTLLIAMEYCDGGSVQDIVRIAKRKCTEQEISAVIAQVLQALVYLHSHHIMHRDIKSGNILLTRNGEAKLADFGVSARLNSTLQKKNTVIGSPYWMAPEIISKTNDGYDSRADIWSLGITAIEMADSEPPRYDIHFARVIFIIPQQPPPTLKHPREWSDEFVDFTTKCLKKDPAERPTARELMQHPFVQKGLGRDSQRLVARMVEGCAPALEEHRRKAAEEGTDDDDSTYGQSDTVVKTPSTLEIRAPDDDETNSSGTFVETNDGGSTSGNKIKGLDLNNITTYA